MNTRVIRIDELTRITGLSRSSVGRQEKRGTFPRRRRLGANSVGWLLHEVLDWAESRDVVVLGVAGAHDEDRQGEER